MVRSHAFLACLGGATLVALAAISCSDDEVVPSTNPVPTSSGTTTSRPEDPGKCGANLSKETEAEVPIHTPRWAFEPWISKDISDNADTYAFVDGFQQRNIPVGVVVLDSPWETNYNSLIPNPKRYGDFKKMVADLRAKDVRTVLWLTAFINSSSLDLETGGDFYPDVSENYNEAVECKFFINNGDEYFWWKGTGGSLDFFNPSATAWWHYQLDKLLIDDGVAGFKLDFGDNYIGENSAQATTTTPVETFAGTVTHQQYSEQYYHDFYRHGVHARGADEFVTMVRPYDKSYEFEGRFFARPEHAPTTWVGDNRRDWFGMSDALDHIFRSAAAGYVVIGSDIGGYLDRDDENLLGPVIPADSEVFLRWTALGALTPFMQLHGRANLTPWTVPGREAESVAAWQYWATLHHQMVPFFYSLAEQAYLAKAKPILRPEGELASWAGDYRFSIGDAFFVAPILEAGNKRDVALPAGTYLDWWTDEEISGGKTISVELPDVSRIPLYLKQGAIVPLAVDSERARLGDDSSKDSLTVIVYPGPTTSRFMVHGEGDTPFAIEASAPSAGAASVKVERSPKPTLLRVRGSFGKVAVDGQALTASTGLAALNAQSTGFWYDATAKSTWIRLPVSTTSRTVTANP